MSPPMTAIAIGDRNSPPAPNAKALGTMPATMAMVVMTMGRARFSTRIHDCRGAVNACVHRLDRKIEQHDRVLGDDAHEHEDADDHGQGDGQSM